MQISLQEIQEFLKEKMNGAKLIATQRKISAPMIQDYYNKLVDGKIPPPINVENDIIIDGQHRYIAGMIFGKLPDIVPWTAPLSGIEKVLWKDIIVDELDWRHPKFPKQ